MKAEFKQEYPGRVVIVLTPESDAEAMLIDQWLRFDANDISAYVERYEDSRIKECTLRASRCD